MCSFVLVFTKHNDFGIHQVAVSISSLLLLLLNIILLFGCTTMYY